MKKLFFYCKNYWLHIILASLSSIVASISTVQVIDILRQLIDNISSGTLRHIFLQITIRIIFVLFIGILSNYFVIALTGYIGAGLLKDLRNDSLKSLLAASPEYITKGNYGDFMERMSEDIEGLAGFISGYFKDCLYVPIITIVYSIYLFFMNPHLALLCLFPLVIMVPLNIILLKPIKLKQFQYVKELGRTNNNIQEVFSGAPIIKSYQLQEKMYDHYYNALKKTFDTSNETDLKQYNLEPISRAIHEIPLAIAICLGGAFVFSGNITIGILIAYISTLKKLIDPLTSSYQLVVRSQTALVSVSRVFEIIDIPPESIRSKNVTTSYNPNFTNILEFNHVSFAYEEDEDVLQDISFHIKQGEKIAFVGESGSGKSTIIKLLSRQVELYRGDILFHGQDYKEINPAQTRNEIALISQDPCLFPISIADNLRIGNPDATVADIENALSMAGCLAFVQELPNGIDTILTEKAGNLSGGQKQRLAIARAIIKDAKILLLDEPTSALDHANEETICHTINDISQNRAIITVAHRLTTIKDYDNIYVLRKGKIVENGKHDDLMSRKGLYYNMYQTFTKIEAGEYAL